MTTIVDAVIVPRPAGEVFDFVATITDRGILHPEMAQELVDPPDHPTRVGETFIENVVRGPLKMRIQWTVTESARPGRWSAVTSPIGKPPAIMDIGRVLMTYQLAETQGGTRVELRMSYTPRSFLTKVADPLFIERSERETAHHALTHLQHAMEGQGTHVPPSHAAVS